MPKDLPVVELVHGDGRRVTLNQTDYARNPQKWLARGFKVGSMADGTMKDAAVDFMRRQAEKEIARARNPNHFARFDARRTWEDQQGPARHGVGLGPDGRKSAKSSKLAIETPAPVLPKDTRAPLRVRTKDRPSLSEIKAMPFSRARDVVREITRKRPRSWAEVEAFLTEAPA